MRYFLIVVFALVHFSIRAAELPLADSLGIEKVGASTFILHQVEEKETLYSLSRRYGVAVKDIIGTNPAVENGLSIGQIVKIPLIVKDVQKTPEGAITHEVQPKETMYSISRKYGVSAEDIKKWNSLTSNNLDIGQSLFIIKPARQTSPPEVPKVQFDETSILHVVDDGETLYSIARSLNVSLDSLRAWNELMTNDISVGDTLLVGIKQVNPPAPRIEDIQQEVARNVDTVQSFSPLAIPSDEISEDGLAEVIKGSSKNRKYLGLHRTVPVGTVMRVRNEMNGQEVFVRIIGKLPDTGSNKNVVIKLSQSAYDSLGAIDARFRVSISYLP